MPPLSFDSLLNEVGVTRGVARWAALQRVAAHPDFDAYLQREHPRWAAAAAMNRRDFLRYAAAAMMLGGVGGLGGCGRAPDRPIVPPLRAVQDEGIGEPRFYATALCFDGYASGVLAESNDGRPTKIEGNPQHPGSLGGTSLQAQAAVLELWDPDRSQAPLIDGRVASWNDYENEAVALARKLEATKGQGLHVLAGACSSPSLEAQFDSLQHRFPQMRRHCWQPWPRSNVFAGSQRAFGRALEPVYHFQAARVVLAFDADFLGSLPGHERYARDFIAGRRADGAVATGMNRLYAIEATPSLTGLFADHRLTLPAAQLENVARSLAARLGVQTAAALRFAADAEGWLTAMADDLLAQQGTALVVAGPAQTPAVHALVHAINARLGAAGKTVNYIEPLLPTEDAFASIAELSRAMHAGEVDTLLLLDVNPLYDAPADLQFAEALQRVPNSHHLGLYADETGQASHWHLPMAHALESWADARAYDGTVSVAQPLLAPLYDGRSPLEWLALWSAGTGANAHALLQAHWRRRALGDSDFDTAWTAALRQGLIAGSAAAPATASLVAGFDEPGPKSPAQQPAQAIQGAKAETLEVEVLFRPDPMVGDGRWANNGWLQELPRTVTQLCWDNAVLVSASLAQRLGLANGDEVRIEQQGRVLEAPVYVMQAGQAADSVTVLLGQGRRSAGRIGDGVGYDGYILRGTSAPWFAGGARLHRTGRHRALVAGPAVSIDDHQPARSAALEQFRANPHVIRRGPHEDGPFASLYPDYPRGKHAWGMSVDLNACIGCGVCTLACQAENNIPVVGPEQARLGRAMHWIRVDSYPVEEAHQQQALVVHQPVPCMHCEQAPCELVCPVGATVHDSEGLNLQVYNRCIGTRFCSNNCPYKVRRFNFLQYSDEHTESLKAQRNPQVTVRNRGVMEKCTYCVQRIRVAEIAADRDGRKVADGEVRTACQAACPTQAIVFGDIQDPHSAVVQAKASPLNYTLLAEENTRPRTTYGARLHNPNPRLASPPAAAAVVAVSDDEAPA